MRLWSPNTFDTEAECASCLLHRHVDSEVCVCVCVCVRLEQAKVHAEFEAHVQHTPPVRYPLQ